MKINTPVKIPTDQRYIGTINEKLSNLKSINSETLHFGEIIAEGYTGVVRIVYDVKKQGYYAIKAFNKAELRADFLRSHDIKDPNNLEDNKDFVEVLIKERERFLEEISILSQLELESAPYVVGFEGILVNDIGNYLYAYAMEYCGYGDLGRFLDNHPEAITWGTLLYFWEQIAKAVDYLHSVGVIHNDLAARNILVTDELKIKIADFNLATNQQQYVSLPRIAKNWAAPEVKKNPHLTSQEAGIYNMGRFFYETIFQNRNDMGEDFEFFEESPYVIPRICKEIIEACCDEDPRWRPTAAEVATEITTRFLSSENLLHEKRKRKIDKIPDSIVSKFNKELKELTKINYKDLCFSTGILGMGFTSTVGIAYEKVNVPIQQTHESLVNQKEKNENEQLISDEKKEICKHEKMSNTEEKKIKDKEQVKDEVGEYLAVKVFCKSELEANPNLKDSINEFLEKFILEMSILSRLDSPYIIRFKGVLVNNKENYLYAYAMEYCGYGNLDQFLQNHKRQDISWGTMLYISEQIAEGMKYLHSVGVNHGDLAPRNILVTDNLKIKIADFNFAQYSPQNSTLLMRKDDIYRMGKVFYKIILGGQYEFQPDDTTFDAILGDGHHQEVPETFKDLTEACCDKDPLWRPEAAEVVFEIEKYFDATKTDEKKAEKLKETNPFYTVGPPPQARYKYKNVNRFFYKEITHPEPMAEDWDRRIYTCGYSSQKVPTETSLNRCVLNHPQTPKNGRFSIEAFN